MVVHKSRSDLDGTTAVTEKRVAMSTMCRISTAGMVGHSAVSGNGSVCRACPLTTHIAAVAYGGTL
eukprot:5519932-Amphidinium_carterae.1